jgi:hypothetical protein
MNISKKISRRMLIKGCISATALGVLALVGGRLAVADADAPEKASKSAVKYQDYPKDGKMCASCKYFIPSGRGGGGMMGGMMHGMMGGTCRVVEGYVSARGYCILYAPQ